MEHDSSQPWHQLFSPPPQGVSAVDICFRLVERRSEPLLLLPENRALAAASLELYPAQTTKARAAKAALKLMLRAGGCFGTRRVKLQLNPANELLQFLNGSLARYQPASFAVLLGNAQTVGRRFILLAFRADGTPTKVVKVGTDAAAIELIRRERAFLKKAPAERTCAPQLLGCLSTDGIEAIALEYCPGKPPGLDEWPAMAPLLISWIKSNESMPLSSLPTWSRLETASDELPLFAKLRRVFTNKLVHSALYHGDFAPWNIRINPGSKDWRVLDWERGELTGPPAWDLFHFVIQPLLLVKKLQAQFLTERVEAMLSSEPFLAYANVANISELSRPLLLAYLLYCRDVLKPSEGGTETSALLELLSRRWASSLD